MLFEHQGGATLPFTIISPGAKAERSISYTIGADTGSRKGMRWRSEGVEDGVNEGLIGALPLHLDVQVKEDLNM